MKKIILFSILSLMFVSCKTEDAATILSNLPAASSDVDLKGTILPALYDRIGTCHSTTGGKFIRGALGMDYDGTNQLFILTIISQPSCYLFTYSATNLITLEYVVNKINSKGGNLYQMDLTLNRFIDETGGAQTDFALLDEVNSHILADLPAKIGQKFYWDLEMDVAEYSGGEINKLPSLIDIDQGQTQSNSLAANEDYPFQVQAL